MVLQPFVEQLVVHKEYAENDDSSNQAEVAAGVEDKARNMDSLP